MSSSDTKSGVRNLTGGVLLVLGVAIICLTVALLLDAKINRQLDLEVLLLGGSGLLLTVAAALMSWRKARRLIRPISDLIDSAERIGNGNYTHPLEVTGRHELAPLEEALEQMRQKLRQTTINTNYLSTVLNSMNDTVLVTSPEGEIRKINAAAERLLGYKEEELRGKMLTDLLLPGNTPDPVDHAPRTIDLQETVIRTASGQTIPVSISGSQIAAADPAFQGTIYVLRDITERKRAERRIRYLARFDSLTKLPNRMQFQHMLQQAIARARRADRGVALLYLDLDRYKEINDTFGHEAGDRVLEILSERLTRALPKEAVLGRLAGDEFAVFIEGLDPQEDERTTTAALARIVLAEISKTFYVEHHELYLTASIGIAFCPRDAENVIDLIRHADAAMYHSKQASGNTFAFYAPEMDAAAVERLMLKSKLRRALERDELVMLYQPKVDLRTGMVVGGEALLRWRLPGHGDISPSQFIPLAEETSLILSIGDWVMNRVCDDYKRWLKHLSNPGRISINLSLKQLRQNSFVTRCRAIFLQHQLSPTSFELEITETTLMQDPKRTIKLLDDLFAMGLTLSIDDFGTGYSSLSSLQQFPISTLKIDQSFVKGIVDDRDDATIVRTIIDMGKSMEMEVVAEGVETKAQLDYLKSHDCHYAQGRLFGDAISAEEFLSLMIAQSRGQVKLASLFG
ncbi:MAG TPA: EAL domain-containing protein [Steroidobacteraceae bacterium]|nr:EAL domain-containing protein [Steroidobacteraceae bacterium]